MFGHDFSNVQWFGASIVMACTFSELLGKKKKDKQVKPTKTADKRD